MESVSTCCVRGLRPAKRITSGGYGLLSASLYDMRVQVQRRARDGMPEAALDSNDIAAASDRPRGEQVAQRVQRYFRRQRFATEATSRKALVGASSLNGHPCLFEKTKP